MSFPARRRDRPTMEEAGLVYPADTPTLYNATCTAANTEYNQLLPAGTRKFMVKARGGIVKLCFTSGQSGTTFIQIADGASYWEDLVLLTGRTVYFQSPTAGCIVEIIAWTS